MVSYDFYISNKEINGKTEECLRDFSHELSMASLLNYIICIIPLIITILLSIFVKWWLSIPLGIVSLFLIAIMSYGYENYCLKIAQEENPNMKNIFSGFSRQIGKIFNITIKRLFLSIFWLIIFIFPCFIKNIGYSMSFMVLADKDGKIENAIIESKRLMKENYKRYFKLILANIHFILLVIITAGIAWTWLGPKLITKKAVFYENLKTEF